MIKCPDRSVILLIVFMTPGFFEGILLSQTSLLDKTIELKRASYTLGDVINELTLEHSIFFSFNDKEVDTKKTVSMSVKPQKLRQILDVVEKQCQVEYSIHNDIIILKPKKTAKKVTISGYIDDASTGERLINATVYDRETYLGTVSNSYGFYSLLLEEGDREIVFDYVGYTSMPLKLNLYRDTVISIKLSPVIELEEVVIVGSRDMKIVSGRDPGLVKLPVSKIQALPSLIGEPDVIKTLQLLPGIQSGREGTANMYVRGGGADQNLMLLDDVPVYNASHLYGFFSVFNSDAIRSVKLYKGGFPARYGGRVSSVVDIRTKEGNTQEFQGKGSIGLMSSRITCEGPIVNDKASFLFSARRTYFDLLTKSLFKKNLDLDMEAAYFYDLSGKLSYTVNSKNRLYWSIYKGQDKFVTSEETNNYSYTEGMDWGNLVSSLRWNRTLSKRMFVNTTASYSLYEFLYSNENGSEFENFKSNFDTHIEDFAFKTDFDFIPSPMHHIKFGAGYIYHAFSPRSSDEHYYSKFSGFEYYEEEKQPVVYPNDINAYIEDEVQVINNLHFNAGLHYAGCIVKERYYQSLQPRLSVSYDLNSISFNASYSHMAQYMHLLPAKDYGSVTDLWLPVTNKIKPVRSREYSLGSGYSLNDKYIFSIEGFYKEMQNIIEFVDASNYTANATDWESLVDVGKGWAYGTEFMVQKTSGRFTGWIGYTLSYSKRKFSDGVIIPFKYDRRHDISVVGSYQLKPNIRAGFLWVYSTGHLMTLPTIKYPSIFAYSEYDFDNDINYYKLKNNFKIPDYHRLDINISFDKQVKKGTNVFTIGIYNLYSRKNPFYIFLTKDNIGNIQVKSMCILPLAPEVRYAFVF